MSAHVSIHDVAPAKVRDQRDNTRPFVTIEVDTGGLTSAIFFDSRAALIGWLSDALGVALALPRDANDEFEAVPV